MNIYSNLFSFFSRRRKFLLFLLFILSIIIQSSFLSFVSNPEDRNQNSDYKRFYAPVAENIMDGKGIIDEMGVIATRYPPGFPVILSPIYRLAKYTGIDRLELISVFNVVISAINCLLIFFIGGMVFNERIGLLGALIWTTYPFNLWLVKQPNSELPFMFLFFLSIFLFIYALNKNRLWFMLFVGVFLALSALVRPISLMLIGVFMIILIFYGRINFSLRVVSIFLLLVGFVITLLPWEYHVYSETGEIIPLSRGGTPSIKDGLRFAIRPKPDAWKYKTPGESMKILNHVSSGEELKVSSDVKDFMVRINNKDHQLQTTFDVFNYVFQEFKENPKTLTKLFVIKTVRSWYGTTLMWYESYILPIQIFYLVLGIAGIVLAFKYHAETMPFILFFITIIFYFWAMTVMAISILRYMIPPMGLILIFAAIPVDRLISRYECIH